MSIQDFTKHHNYLTSQRGSVTNDTDQCCPLLYNIIINCGYWYRLHPSFTKLPIVMTVWLILFHCSIDYLQISQSFIMLVESMRI